MITVLVTHWDDAEKCGKNIEQERYLEIKGLLQKYGVNSIIFSSINQNGDYLCSQIDQVLLNAKNEKIELTETEFYFYFHLIEFEEDIEDELSDQLEKARVHFIKKTNIIKKIIDGFDENDPNITQKLLQIAAEIPKFMQDTCKQFEKCRLIYDHELVSCFIRRSLAIELIESPQSILKLIENKLNKQRNYTKHSLLDSSQPYSLHDCAQLQLLVKNLGHDIQQQLQRKVQIRKQELKVIKL